MKRRTEGCKRESGGGRERERCKRKIQGAQEKEGERERDKRE